jgi:hypothetical protein
LMVSAVFRMPPIASGLAAVAVATLSQRPHGLWAGPTL